MTESTIPGRGLPELAARRVPARGGLNPTLIRLELRRALRNRRTLIFTLIVPPVFYLLFGPGKSYSNSSAGHGNVVAYIMVSMALYGCVIATTSGGAAVSVERAAGWSRQLRLTPLKPAAYIATKCITAMCLGLVGLVITYILGSFTGAKLTEPWLWVVCPLITWVGSLLFAAFGLFMGYLLPSENVMQILGPVLAILAFAGGLFVPIDDSTLLGKISAFTPLNGLSNLVHAPLAGGGVKWYWVVNLLVWMAIFAGGAIWRFRKDTQRV